MRHNRFMQSAAIRKWLLALTLLAVFFWTIVHFYNLNAERAANSKRIIIEPQGDFSYRKTNISAGAPKKEETDSQAVLQEKVDDWLTRHHHSAESLLAAFHVLNDTNLLREAATNYPNDPRVELAVLSRNAFPEDRRKWLDLFKASSPSNSLADYLSAQTYFQNGQSAAAVKDLVAATGKPDFENYSLESQLNAEEFSQFLGKSPLESTTTALAGAMEDMPLTTLKQLASEMADLQKQELNVGDNNSAENLAEMGTVLGGQLSEGASGRYVLNQLVGFGVETMMLQQLDPNTSYDFLDGQTPAEKLRQVRDQKAMLDQLNKSFMAVEPNLSEAEMVSFADRSKIYGEIAAMRWVLDQHGNP